MERYSQACNVFSNHHRVENEDGFLLPLDLAFHEHDWWKHYRFHHGSRYHEQKRVRMSEKENGFRIDSSAARMSCFLVTLNVFTAE